MSLFKNFIVVFILVGIVTRISNHLFMKYMNDKALALYVSTLLTASVICTLFAFIIGFDVVVSEYLIAFIAWFIFDLLRKNINKEEEK